MPNVTVGDNVVIGTGSIVTRYSSNSIAAGVPCRVIKTLEEYYEKCRLGDYTKIWLDADKDVYLIKNTFHPQHDHEQNIVKYLQYIQRNKY